MAGSVRRKAESQQSASSAHDAPRRRPDSVRFRRGFDDERNAALARCEPRGAANTMTHALWSVLVTVMNRWHERSRSRSAER